MGWTRSKHSGISYKINKDDILDPIGSLDLIIEIIDKQESRQKSKL